MHSTGIALFALLSSRPAMIAFLIRMVLIIAMRIVIAVLCRFFKFVEKFESRIHETRSLMDGVWPVRAPADSAVIVVNGEQGELLQ